MTLLFQILFACLLIPIISFDKVDIPIGRFAADKPQQFKRFAAFQNELLSEWAKSHRTAELAERYRIGQKIHRESKVGIIGAVSYNRIKAADVRQK